MVDDLMVTYPAMANLRTQGWSKRVTTSRASSTRDEGKSVIVIYGHNLPTQQRWMSGLARAIL